MHGHFLRKTWLVLVLCATASAFVPREASAEGGPGNKTFGLGLQLGAPLGITGKAFFTPVVAIQFGVGLTFPYSGLGAWFDVVFHFVEFHTRRDDLMKMSLYVGPGLQVGVAGPYYYSVVRGPGGSATYTYAQGPFAMGIRVPFGFAIHWQKVTFDTFIELAPVVYLVPGLYAGAEGGIGGRYYF